MSLFDFVAVEPAKADLAIMNTAAEARGPVVPPRSVDAVLADRASRSVAHTDERAEQINVPGIAGEVPVRIIAPDGLPARAVRVTAHASGWSLATPELDDAVGGQVATDAGVVSVSVGYRLAPESPFPAAVDDITSALVWAAESAVERHGTDRVYAAGASAGSHLMLLAVLRLRRERPDLFARLAALDLRYGCYDLSQTPSLRAADNAAPIVTSAGTAAYLSHFIPGVSNEDRRDGALSPLYADLVGLPPALLAVGSRDGLLDDSTFLASRLAVAGVPTTLQIWQGCTHVFDSLSPQLGVDYVSRLTAWWDAINADQPGRLRDA